MNRVVVGRRAVLHTGCALGVSLFVPAARACEFFTTNLRIVHPWSRATAEGDSFAVLCMRFDQVARPDRLIGVQTPVAEGADMGGPLGGPGVDFTIPPGRESELSESGTFIRLLGLKHPLEVGRSYPLTLVFERTGAVDADIDVDYERESHTPA
ncbi:MAG TPA: copper chaperone PCu(A)C [Albitalea sp.]|nr:copper chaperone PCu(A)C [Albitalea sp.]